MSFALIVFSSTTNAQNSILQNAMARIYSYKNFSYQSIRKIKELWAADTTMKQYKSVFLKAPENKNFGYFFNVETHDTNNKLADADVYNGQDIIHINPGDSTYATRENLSFDMQSTIPGCLQWIQSRLENYPVKTVKVKDTTINAITCSHLIITVWDTVIDKERNYTEVNLFIDESSGMPDLIVTKSRNTTFGSGVSTYYSESCYFDHKINQDSINTTSLTIPDGFHQQTAQAELPRKPNELLSPESDAPAWILFDSEGRKMSLAQLKGKVILIDFFFIGCGSCLEVLKPLSRLHKKYQGQNVALVSMTFRDNKKASAAFRKIYNINYPIYIDAGGVVEAYKVEAFPTFYFIDKKGKVAKAIAGYDPGFEEKAAAMIDKLLSR